MDEELPLDIVFVTLGGWRFTSVEDAQQVVNFFVFRFLAEKLSFDHVAVATGSEPRRMEIDLLSGVLQEAHLAEGLSISNVGVEELEELKDHFVPVL